MQTDRRTILSLVASGRITSAEAERLLVLSNERTETIWTLAACLAAVLLLQEPFRPFAIGYFRYVPHAAGGHSGAIHQVQFVLTQVIGGIYETRIAVKLSEMLAAGKITADEAERLLDALEPDSGTKAGAVWVDTTASGNGTKSGARRFSTEEPRAPVEADEPLPGTRA